jgi:anti-sigma factor RsiW
MGVKLTFTDLDLQAFVDGELTAEEEKCLEVLLLADPVLRKRCKDLLAQKDLLKKWWDQHHSNPD